MNNRRKMCLTEVIAAIIGLTISLALSWGISIGLVWLVCLCFGWAFSLKIATGIWLVCICLRSLFKPASK